MLSDALRFFLPLVQPVGFLWLFLLISAGWMLWKRQRRAAFLLFLPAVFISIFSSNLSARLLHSLEKPYARSANDDLPEADAVVMLGGTHGYAPHEVLGFAINDAGDRILAAVELVRQKKAPVLVLGGGAYHIDGESRPDAELLERWFKAWDMPAAPVIPLGICAHTRDEAVKCRELALEKGWTRILLVTSASHMRRAEGVFKKTGLEVVPVACDFQTMGGTDPGAKFNPFPQVDGFNHLTRYLRETIGWIIYRLRGWIGGPAPEPLRLKEPPPGQLVAAPQQKA